MANFTSVHTGATIDASVTIISGSGVTQSDLTKLNAVTSSAVELNILDGVTASTAEINILDGLTASTTELNYLDGADSSITTLSLPDNTTITTFGASLVDDADAATARTTLGVDVAGTDNSTDVTLVTTSYDYLSLSGQAITLGQIDISDDTNLVGGDGLALTGDTLSVNVDDSSMEINSDTLRVKASGVTNAMLANSSLSYGGVSVALGASDATPAFDLSDATSLPIVAGTTGTLSVARGGTGATTASGARTNLNVDVAGTDNSTDVTLVTTSHDYLSLSGQAVTLGQIDISDDTNLVGGTGITLTGDTLSTTDSEIVHDNLSGFVSNEHIDHSSVSITAGTGLSGGGDITTTRTLTTDDSAIVHDNLSGFVANEHIDHSGVSITAGAGLTGGGDITSTRDIAVGAGTGVTVNADDIAIGQDVATSADVEFNSVTADIIGDIRGATKFTAKADVALNIGDAVYISGVSGNTPTVDIADANDASKMPSFGLAGSSVSINGSVEIFTFGTLPGLNTSSFSVGDILYVSTNGTSGNTLTATKPTGESSLLQNIGTVQRSHASAGSIKVGGAGRTNATPNLDDGDIFIGNGSNQAVTAALNTKIQDYLNTGVNLPSPTFSGDIDFDDASTPVLKITDTTNTVSTIIKSDDSFGNIGTVSNHHLKIKRNDVDVMTFFSGYTAINNDANDYDFRVKDSSGNWILFTDAANSRVGILDGTPSYTLDVNGTGRFTGAVQLDDNLTVTGDLQVNGTTTTVNQTNLDVSDNIIGLNRGASSNANDSGIIIERGSTGDNAAIIFDESADKFTVGTTTSTPSATGNITVTTGTMVANVEGDLTGNVTGDVTGDVTGNADTATALATGRTISLTGDVTGTSASFDGSGNVALATTIAANSVALGTDTTGNYMSDLTEGTGIDITHTPAEGSNATIALDLTEVGFGGGANRLITDDGDGTVTAESELTYSGGLLDISGSVYSIIRLNETDVTNNPAWWTVADGGSYSIRLNNTGTYPLSITTNASNDAVDSITLGYNTSVLGYLTANDDVRLAATKKLYLDGGGNTYIDEPSGDQLRLVAGGTEVLKGYSGGAIDMYGGSINRSINIGANRTGDASSFIDLVGDTTYTDYGARLIRNSGANGITDLAHRGTGALRLRCQDAGAVLFMISDAEKMRIDSSGRLLIGDTSVHYTGTDLQVGNTSDSQNGIQIQTSTTGYGYVLFGDGTGADAYRGQISYKHGDDYMSFFTSGSERMRIDATGTKFSENFSATDDILHINPANGHNRTMELAGDAINVTITGGSSTTLKLQEDGGNVSIGEHLELPYGEINDAGTDMNIVSTNALTLGTESGTALTFANASLRGVFADDVSIPVAKKLYFGGGDHTYISEDADDRLRFFVGGVEFMRFTESTGNSFSIYEDVYIPDDKKIHFGGGNDLKIYHYNAAGDSRINVANNPLLITYNDVDRFRLASGDLVINEGGGDYNFRVEGDTDANLLFVDAGTDRVGIGTNSPSTITEIKSTIPVLTLTDDQNKSWTSSDGTLGKLSFKTSDTSGIGVHEIGFISLDCDISSSTTPNGELVFGTAGVNAAATEKMRIDDSGFVGIGTASPDSKLQVEYTTTSNGSAAIAEFGTSGSGAIANSGHQVIVGGPSVSGYTGMMIYSDSTSGVGQISFADGRGANDSWRGTIAYEHANDRMEFWTNATEKIAINSDGDFIPAGDGTQDLGASSKRWGVVYSADLDLSNEGSQNDVDGTWGSYVIQEGEDDLFLINRRNGKKYKFMLQEVQD